MKNAIKNLFANKNTVSTYTQVESLLVRTGDFVR